MSAWQRAAGSARAASGGRCLSQLASSFSGLREEPEPRQRKPVPSLGEAHDARLAGKLLPRPKSGAMLLADRSHDADRIRELAMKKECVGQHPSRKAIAAIRSASVSLPRSQPGRVIRQPDQTMSSGSECYDRLAANMRYGSVLTDKQTRHNALARNDWNPGIHLPSFAEIPFPNIS